MGIEGKTPNRVVNAKKKRRPWNPKEKAALRGQDPEKKVKGSARLQRVLKRATARKPPAG